MQKVVIFGGSGFIGTHLVRDLAARGVAEIVVADIADPLRRFPGVKYVRVDVREPIPADIVSGPATAINLAAVHRTPGHEDHEYFDTNVKGARNVADFCERTGCGEIWLTSSIAVYGPSEEPLTEKSELRPNSAYGKSKRQAELIHLEWAGKDPQRKLVIVRPAVTFGAGENGNFTRLAKALKKGFFVYPGRRDTIKACGYVADLIGSLRFMSERPERVTLYNYAYPRPYTIEEICESFAAVGFFRRPLGTVPLPLMVNAAKVFRFLNGIGLKNGIHPERMYKLTRSTYIVPQELIDRGYPYVTDLRKGIELWREDEPRGEFV